MSGKERDALNASFESNYVPEPNSGCWLWLGRPVRTGYGQIMVAGVAYRAHRLSYLLHSGDIPAGMHVLHSCDVPACVNPKHLRLGTHLDNMRDMMARGRHRTVSGEKHYKRAKRSDYLEQMRDHARRHLNALR